MSFYEKDQEGNIVPYEGEVPQEAVSAIERADDAAIVQKLTTGIAPSVFIYSYPIQTKEGKRQVIGINTQGAYEVAKLLGNIEILPDVRVDKDSDPEYFYAMVRAKDLLRNTTLIGVGRHCKFMVDKSNKPLLDRPNEHAFVSSISKAQRNVILHLAPQDALVKIVNAFDKSGKYRELKPPTLETEPAAAPAPSGVLTITAEGVKAQQEKLKGLRLRIHNRFQTELGIDQPRRKPILKKHFGVESLTEMSEQQLNKCLALIDEFIEKGIPEEFKWAPPAEDKEAKAKELGFESAKEHERLRATLYTLLAAPTNLGLTDIEGMKWLSDRRHASTKDIEKQVLLGLIEEANRLIAAKNIPDEF